MGNSQPPPGIGGRRQMSEGRREDDLDRRDQVVRTEAEVRALKYRVSRNENDIGQIGNRLDSLAKQLWLIMGGLSLAIGLSGYVANYVIQLQSSRPRHQIEIPANPDISTDQPEAIAESQDSDG